jgi:signal transduction histidine kinase/ligand-binding sensor domain-containing protein
MTPSRTFERDSSSSDRLVRSGRGGAFVVSTWLVLAWLNSANLLANGNGSAEANPKPAVTGGESIPTVTARELGYSVTHWTVENGLPMQTVTSLAQTPDGYLWCGTIAGLARFDGARFHIFSGREVPALDGVEILELLSDSQGRLWIGGINGEIVVYEAGRFRRLGKQDGIPRMEKPKLGEDPQGDFWINAHAEGKLYRYHHGHFEVVTWPKLLPDEIDRFRANRDGPAWAVHDQRRTLERFTTNGPEPYVLTAPDGKPEHTLGRFFDLQDGRLAVNSKYGIYALGTSDWALFHSFPEPLPGPVLDGIEDWFGNFWISVFGSGLVFSSREGLTAEARLPEASQFAFHRSLLLDREGNLWVAGEDGLYRIRRAAFRPQPIRKEPQPLYYATGVVEASSGTIWLLNEVGWSRQKGQGWETVEHGYPDLRLWTGAAGPDGSVFLGYWLPRLTTRPFVEQITVAGERRRLGTFPSNVQVIFRSRTGELWVGAGNLWRWETNRFVAVPHSPFSEVLGIAEDQAGRLFVADGGKGIFQRKAGGWQRLTGPRDVGSDRIMGLHFDSDGVLWLATTQGIARWKDGQWFAYPDLSRTIGTAVRAVMSDNEGNLWISSNQGVTRIARRILNDLAEGKPTDLVSERFGRADGLPSLKGVPRQSSLLQATDGRIWAVVDKGAAVMDLREWSHYRQRLTPPPVHIEAVLIDDLPAGGEAFTHSAAPTELLVPPGKHRVEIRYVAINLTTGKNHYRYRVEGLDNRWVDAGEQRTVVFHWPPPGHYRFQVIADTQYGIRNAQGASLAFYVQPHWWQTSWFYWGLGALAVGLLWLTRFLKLHQLQREQARREAFTRQLIQSQELERKRIAGELHDSMGQDLILIKNTAYLALRKCAPAPPVQERLHEVAELAAHALTNARAITSNLRPPELDRLGLTAALEAMVDKSAEHSGVEFVARIENVDGVWQPEREINVYRVVQESLNNALKHANPRRIRLEVKRNGSDVLIILEDDGCGFDPGQLTAPGQPPGMGLTSLRERLKILGGVMELNSTRGAGTSLRYWIPVSDHGAK